MATVDVVVVSYNSRDHLRACVEPLASVDDVHVIVVDNASPDAGLDVVADLPITRIARQQNGGFGAGCNTGWRVGDAPYVLFLNPDARIDAESLRRLAGVLDATPGAGGVAPRITHVDGSLDFSQRRFPRLRSTYARALFCTGSSRARSGSTSSSVSRRLRGAGVARLGFGRLLPRQEIHARATRRLRRRFLHVLRGHRPLSPATGRGTGPALRTDGGRRRTKAGPRRLVRRSCRSSLPAGSGMRQAPRATAALVERLGIALEG